LPDRCGGRDVLRWNPAAILLVALLTLAGCTDTPPTRILCLGDSITYGIMRSGSPPEVDARGGYPGRLEERLGGRVRVLRRALGGATAQLWLTDPRADVGARFWDALHKHLPELPDGPPPDAASVALGVFQVERPTVIVILLGVNDLAYDVPRRGLDVIDEVADRLATLRRQGSSVAPAVLVSTVLPSHRDPAPWRDRLNARIRKDHPDFLPLGERFDAAGWERLLADEIHPNAEGYEVLAAILAEELVSRGLVPSAERASNSRR
jgi:lysophospholipase L1-like esterase